MLAEIKKRLMNARKNKNKEEIGIYATLLGEVAAVGKNKGNRETTNEEAMGVIQKFVKNLEESIKVSGKATEKMKKELEIYKSFLPKQMSREEIKEIIASLGTKNIGEIMRHFKENYAGKYNGKEVSELAREA